MSKKELNDIREVVAFIGESIEDGISRLSAIRDSEKAAALNAAGGDKYKINDHGFDPKRFDIITKAEEFLRQVKAAAEIL